MLTDFDQESAKEWAVYVPLIGLELTALGSDTLDIGNIRLKKMNELEMAALRNKVDLIIVSASAPHDAAKIQANRSSFQKMLDTIDGTVCAEYHATGEPQRAREIAEEQTQDILDLLSYFISFRYPKSYNIAVGLQGELARSVRMTLLLSSAEDGFHLDTRAPRQYAPLFLTPDDVEYMKKLGVFYLANMLKKTKLNGFEETLLDGIRWFATSQRQLKKTLEFVSLVTCLENCLTVGDGDPIALSIAERCALLLGETLQSRQRLRKEVRYLYSLRSRILHDGITESRWRSTKKDAEICPDFDSCLARLRYVTLGLLANLVRRKDEFKFRSKRDLLDWIDEEKLTPKKSS